MGNIVYVIGQSFLYVLLFACLPSVVEALVTAWWRRKERFMPPSKNVLTPIRSTPPPQPKRQRQVQQACKPENVAVSTSSETPRAVLSFSIGFDISILKVLAKAFRAPVPFSRYAARLTVSNVPARWIPSPRKRKKLRRKLTPQYL